MLKKVLYHGGFALLGIALLIGIGVLQANGLRATDDLSTDSEPAASTTVDDSPVADAAPAVPASDAPAPVEAKPIEVANLPTSTPAPNPVQDVKNPLEDATAFSIFDNDHKTSSKKNFKATSTDLHHAQAYYEHLTHHHKHAVIKARVNGDWVSVSAKDFSAFLQNTN